MTALAKDRLTPERDGVFTVLGAAAAKKFYAGAIACRNASGYATPGAAATGLVGLGRVEEQVDNTNGSAGDVTVKIRRGVFQYANSADGDAITAADIGNPCYIVDDQTVAKTSNDGARSVAGWIVDVDAQGVWVLFGDISQGPILGVTPGMKIARGQHTTVTAADTIVSGLAKVVAVVATLDSDLGDDPEWVSATNGDQAGAPAAGSFILKTWKNTAGNDPTPAAATTFAKKVNWIAIGF